MKVVVIGGIGLIGSRLCRIPGEARHEVLAAAPNTGVGAVTGVGLECALHRAEVVVDVANAPTFGVPIDDRTLTPDDDALLGSTTFASWLSATTGQA